MDLAMFDSSMFPVISDGSDMQRRIFAVFLP